MKRWFAVMAAGIVVLCCRGSVAADAPRDERGL